MKLSILSVTLLSGAVLAAPAPVADAEAFPITELLGSDLTLEEHALTKRQYSSSSYNQLTDGTACRPVTVIYARGTSQQGNVGDSAAVGPLFFNNLASRIGGTGQLAIQGVTYPANVAGFLAGGDAAGSTTMTNLINTVSDKRTMAYEC
jgi:cutinase